MEGGRGIGECPGRESFSNLISRRWEVYSEHKRVCLFKLVIHCVMSSAFKQHFTAARETFKIILKSKGFEQFDLNKLIFLLLWFQTLFGVIITESAQIFYQ